MALTHEDIRRSRPGSPSRYLGVIHHGRVQLAEVVPIRPQCLPQGLGTSGRLTKIAQVIASLRSQATSGVTPPRPPSLPVPLRPLPAAAAPDDAA
jgi:hypothetical protein